MRQRCSRGAPPSVRHPSPVTLIHGTDDPKSFDRKASHGCIRAPEALLEVLWKEAKVGTEVVIFESQPVLVGQTGLSDLDMAGVR